MLLTVSTTHQPATDLGYLLVKHPERVHAFDVPTGTAHVFYPDASPDRCTAALLLDVDPARPTGRTGRSQPAPENFTLGRFVNDRPYAASSLLAAALAKVFRSALRGDSKDRPALAASTLPLEIRVPVLRCRGGAELAMSLFAPLGWSVRAVPIPLDDTADDEDHPLAGDSPYVDLTLAGTLRLADALNHLYVLLPVLDDAKHYWVAPDEIDKLLRAGDGWLAAHPERILIIRRYLAHRRALADTALDRLRQDDVGTGEATAVDEEAELPVVRRQSLAAARREAVLAALADTGASRVLDLGCGGGALLADLMKDRRYTEIVGTDVSSRALEIAERKLRLDRLPERQRARLTLWQSALTYTDDRLKGFDAAVLMEVIEHVDPPRLAALEAAVFGHARPGAVVVTTPNAEYNVRYPGLVGMRHSDHRFEWNRAEFQDWANRAGAAYDYAVSFRGVGDDDPETGTPTQLALFTAVSAATS